MKRIDLKAQTIGLLVYILVSIVLALSSLGVLFYFMKQQGFEYHRIIIYIKESDLFNLSMILMDTVLYIVVCYLVGVIARFNPKTNMILFGILCGIVNMVLFIFNTTNLPYGILGIIIIAPATILSWYIYLRKKG